MSECLQPSKSKKTKKKYGPIELTVDSISSPSLIEININKFKRKK